jgi:hypothetical protein
MAADRTNIALRLARKTGNNRGCAGIEFIFLTFSRRLHASWKAQNPRSSDKFCIQDLAVCPPLKGLFMAETIVKLRLNQQQLELMDRTIAQGVAPDRVSLVRLALREYAAARQKDTATEPAR